jgi:hypothetical protein
MKNEASRGRKPKANGSRLRRDGDQLWFVFASSPNHAVPELVEGLPAHKANTIFVNGFVTNRYYCFICREIKNH